MGNQFALLDDGISDLKVVSVNNALVPRKTTDQLDKNTSTLITEPVGQSVANSN